MIQQKQTAAHVLTFTDLIYAALMSFGLALFGTAAAKHNMWAVTYLAACTVWLVYDWYANHYFAVHEQLGGLNIPLDVISLLQYAGLLYAASITSPWILFFLAVRGARGIVYNEVALRRDSSQPLARERLRSYNFSSGFMVATYVPLFLYDLYDNSLMAGWRLTIAVAIWLLAYGIALAVESFLVNRKAKEQRSDGQLCAEESSHDRTIERDIGVGAGGQRRMEPVQGRASLTLFLALVTGAALGMACVRRKVER